MKNVFYLVLVNPHWNIRCSSVCVCALVYMLLRKALFVCSKMYIVYTETNVPHHCCPSSLMSLITNVPHHYCPSSLLSLITNVPHHCCILYREFVHNLTLCSLPSARMRSEGTVVGSVCLSVCYSISHSSNVCSSQKRYHLPNG